MSFKKNEIFYFLSIVFVVISFFTLFTNIVVNDEKITSTEITGFEIIFGTSDGLAFSIGAFILLLLIIISIVSTILTFFLNKKYTKILNIISIICGIIGGILFFLFNSSILINSDSGIKWDDIAEYHKLSFTAVLGGVSLLISSIFVGLNFFVDKK